MSDLFLKKTFQFQSFQFDIYSVFKKTKQIISAEKAYHEQLSVAEITNSVEEIFGKYFGYLH